ncbi:MAG: acyl-CoA synthetase [Phyllobacteriaceae bacterium]|nr:acyl-CoA synthetase [Phyllobacteriaceae bacterium]
MPVATISDIDSIEATPLSARALPPNTYAALQATALRTPDAPALSFFLTAESFEHAHTWTYGELLAEITRAANLFHAHGVTRDAPVAFVLPNLPETHFTIWGGEAAGVVFAVNPLLEPAHIAELLRVARVRMLVTLAPTPLPGDLWSRLSPHLATLPDLQIVACVSLEPYLSSERAPAFSQAAENARSTTLPAKVIDFRAELAKQPSDRLIAGDFAGPRDRSSYFCTGGTTGLPKIAVRTHGNEVFDAWAVGQILCAPKAPRTFFCGLPLFHVNAQLVTGLIPWMNGDHVVIGTPEGYRGEGVLANFWKIVNHYSVTMFSGVPTIFAALLAAPVGDNDISSLDFAICGAAPMPANLIGSFETATGVKILEGYGLTEAACVSSVNPPEGERRAGSIGLRLPYQEMRVVIPDDEGKFVRSAAVDENGLIAIRGPNVFSGYLHAEHNEGLWLEIDGEAWLNTGDLGRQDADGYFWLSGRKKELIIRGGHNIDPKIIEEALSQHPAVALAAAIGSPDPQVGEIPVAHVQIKPGAEVTEKELLDFAASMIPERAAVPKRIRISDALPKTAVGKIFKPALQQLEIDETIREEARRVGAALSEVKVERDSRLGMVTKVRTETNERQLREALDRFSFKVEFL